MVPEVQSEIELEFLDSETFFLLYLESGFLSAAYLT